MREHRLAGHRRRDVPRELLLLAAHGRDRDELQGTRREIRGRTGHNQTVTVRQPDPTPGGEPERGFVVAVLAQGIDPDEELAELKELARTAGVDPVGELVQHRPRPEQRTYVGKGKLEELRRAFEAAGADVLLVDDELDPSQQRTLENSLEARVVDRTQLILDIFAQHAISAEGKLQVELAQLEYNLPRMRGLWKHLERLGGGVGTRGPGESQLETDRRLARRRISILRGRLKQLSNQRTIRRKERKRTEAPTVALAGYTNVGKSTLLNALTGADVTVRDRLFETLDPTTRAFEHEGRRYLVTDTVGFIRRLPTQLVEGFAATLEETLVADLVLHVVDASAADDRLEEMVFAVDSVLGDIEAGGLPVEIVLNKIDAVDALRRRRLGNRFPDSLQVSARTGEGIEELRARIAERFANRFELVRLFVPHAQAGRLSELYALGTPIEERVDSEEGVLVTARLPHREVLRFAQYLVADAPAASRRAT
jgi:GTPase